MNLYLTDTEATRLHHILMAHVERHASIPETKWAGYAQEIADKILATQIDSSIRTLVA